MKIVTAKEMKSLEDSCLKHGITYDDLMEKAGHAIAETARDLVGTVVGTRILILIGPGNNGADGLVAARYLAEWGGIVTGYTVTPRLQHDHRLQLAQQYGMLLIGSRSATGLKKLNQELDRSHLIIDAVLGTGNSRPLSGLIETVLSRLSDVSCPVLSVDLPTGTNANDGTIDPATPTATVTVALGFPKLGHVIPPGSERSGRLIVADIGIPPDEAQDIKLNLLTQKLVQSQLPQRPPQGHKGTFGHALVIGGSTAYPGAAYLATQSALRSGTGLVTLASPETIYPILASKLTEAIHQPLPDDKSGGLTAKSAALIKEQLSNYDSVAVGCGMGWSVSGKNFIEELCLDNPHFHQPLVIDADGLNNLSDIDNWWHRLSESVVLTPHPGEMARLTNVPINEIQSDRIRFVQHWARKWRKVIVLKGANTVIADHMGNTWVNPISNPILATGGTGDVLTGIIAGLMAQGLPIIYAACCAVFAHAMCSGLLSETMGDRGGLASDLVESLPLTFRQIIKS